MPDKNKTKLLIGLGLLLTSFICAAVILFFVGKSSRKSTEETAALQVQLANLMAENSQGRMGVFDAKRTRRAPVMLEDFLAKAESIYGREELERKEGILWIDRKSSACLVSLGLVNGLKIGGLLTIYQGDKKIGSVEAERPFDIISYVKIVGKSLDDFDSDYYRVKME